MISIRSSWCLVLFLVASLDTLSCFAWSLGSGIQPHLASTSLLHSVHQSSGADEMLDQKSLLSSLSSSGMTATKPIIRRDYLLSMVSCGLLGASQLCSNADSASAAVTDETNSFATNGLDSSYRNSVPATTNDMTFQGWAQEQLQEQSVSVATPTDECTIAIPKSKWSETKNGLGLELGQAEFRTNIRVFVKSTLEGSLADSLGIQKNWIVVSVNGKSTERTNADGVAQMVSQAYKATPADGIIELQFRDPSAFRKQLASSSSSSSSSNNNNDLTQQNKVLASTQVAPAGDTTQRNQDGSIQWGQSVSTQDNQRLTVTQLLPPKLCHRGATTNDLLEISYLGIVLDTGAVFDGSAIKINGEAIPGRGNDVSLYFVLGKQPFGQFPPGWDVGLEGMCVGERRRLVIPPVLAYGSTGLPRRGIPPNATLQYDISLISINGLATPQ